MLRTLISCAVGLLLSFQSIGANAAGEGTTGGGGGLTGLAVDSVTSEKLDQWYQDAQNLNHADSEEIKRIFESVKDSKGRMDEAESKAAAALKRAQQAQAQKNARGVIEELHFLHQFWGDIQAVDNASVEPYRKMYIEVYETIYAPLTGRPIQRPIPPKTREELEDELIQPFKGRLGRAELVRILASIGTFGPGLDLDSWQARMLFNQLSNARNASSNLGNADSSGGRGSGGPQSNFSGKDSQCGWSCSTITMREGNGTALDSANGFSPEIVYLHPEDWHSGSVSFTFSPDAFADPPRAPARRDSSGSSRSVNFQDTTTSTRKKGGDSTITSRGNSRTAKGSDSESTISGRSSSTIKVPTIRVPTPNINNIVPRISIPTVRVPTVTVRAPTVSAPSIKVPTPTINIRPPNIGSTITGSDIRLKRDVAEVGELPNGLHLYRYRYVWSETVYVGVMAQEVAERVPAAVVQREDGYLGVDYSQLGLRLQTWDEWLSGRDTRATQH